MRGYAVVAAYTPQKFTPRALVRSAALGCKSVGGVEPSSGRSKTYPIPISCSSAIADYGLKFSAKDQDIAIRSY